jgi:hypothetical protein
MKIITKKYNFGMLAIRSGGRNIFYSNPVLAVIDGIGPCLQSWHATLSGAAG